MATIRKRANPSGQEVWVRDFVDQAGKRRNNQFKRKRDADRFLTGTLNAISNGTYVHASDSPSLEDGINIWLDQCKTRIGIGGHDNLERATYEDYRGKVHNHLLNADYGIGNYKVSTLTTGIIDDFRLNMIDRDVRGRSQANATKTVAVLRGFQQSLATVDRAS